MTPDLLLLGGVVIVLLSIPAIISSITNRQSPLYAFGIAMLGGIFVLAAYSIKPGGYTVNELPGVVSRLTGYFFG
jgi:hypothetical protein